MTTPELNTHIAGSRASDIVDGPKVVEITRGKIASIGGVLEPFIEIWGKIRSLVGGTEELSSSTRDQISRVMVARTAANDQKYGHVKHQEAA